MTTLDPSHFPFGSHGRTTGAAVHTSVAPAKGHQRATTPDEDDDVDSDLEWFEKRKRALKHKRRKERDEARAQGRIPTLPVPDIRFEQSYLLSLQPFIHASTSAGPSLQTTTTDAEPHMNRDKRRRVEESLSLVEDPASRSGSAFDALLAPRPGSTVSVEWGQVAYITVRDQLFSPLVQGALWALGGIALSSFYSYMRPVQSANSGSVKGKLGGQGGLFSKLTSSLGLRTGP